MGLCRHYTVYSDASWAIEKKNDKQTLKTNTTGTRTKQDIKRREKNNRRKQQYATFEIYQYSNMDPRLSGQNCKFLKFLLSLNSKRDLDTKKTPLNIEACPESLGAMLEY